MPLHYGAKRTAPIEFQHFLLAHDHNGCAVGFKLILESAEHGTDAGCFVLYCFRLSNHFGVLQERFKGRLGLDLVLLTVTFDPVRDQPDVLARFTKTWKADPTNWHFLAGTVPNVQRVTNLFGMEFFPDESLMDHSLHTAVIDRHGRLVANIEGNQFTAEQLGDLVQSVLGP